MGATFGHSMNCETVCEISARGGLLVAAAACARALERLARPNFVFASRIPMNPLRERPQAP